MGLKVEEKEEEEEDEEDEEVEVVEVVVDVVDVVDIVYVPCCKSSGTQTRALSSDLHAHLECSDLNMCTANAVT